MADKNMLDKHEIVDVQVEKLGLVTAGANGEEFFLLKSNGTNGEKASGETQNPNETNNMDHMEAAVANTIWARMAKVFKRVFESDNADAIESNLAIPVVETPLPELSDTGQTELSNTADLAKVCAADTGDNTDKEDDEDEESMSKSIPILTEIVETRTIMSDVIVPVPGTGTIETVAKSDYEVLAKSVELLKDRLAKAEADAESARDSRERDARISKAAELTALPVTAVELGGNLHKLAKLDPALAQYFDALVKTADNMLNGLGVFQEYGTSQTPELTEPVMKAANSADPRAALLSLNARDAAKYVASRQAATRRGGTN